MNQINFKLSKLNISTLKEISKLGVIPQNLIIKTDKEKNIIFVFTNLRIELNLKKYSESIIFKTDYKSENDFIVLKNKNPIITKYNYREEQSVSKQISPIIIPPIDDYDVRISFNNSKPFLEMISDKLTFGFPLDDLPSFVENNLTLNDSELHKFHSPHLTLKQFKETEFYKDFTKDLTE
jgi:hypothetical protein